MHILCYKLTSNSLKILFLPVQRPPGGLELRDLEAYPKSLKTLENSSYKNDFIFNNLSSQSKDKAYIPGLRKCARTPPPQQNNYHHAVFGVTGQMFMLNIYQKYNFQV